MPHLRPQKRKKRKRKKISTCSRTRSRVGSGQSLPPASHFRGRGGFHEPQHSWPEPPCPQPWPLPSKQGGLAVSGTSQQGLGPGPGSRLAGHRGGEGSQLGWGLSSPSISCQAYLSFPPPFSPPPPPPPPQLPPSPSPEVIVTQTILQPFLSPPALSCLPHLGRSSLMWLLHSLESWPSACFLCQGAPPCSMASGTSFLSQALN